MSRPFARPSPSRSALALAALAACGRAEPGGRTESSIEAQIRHSLGAQLAPVGAAVTAVTCSGPACRASLDGGGELALTATVGAGGAVDWTLDGLVVAAAPLEAELRDRLDELGVTAAIDCGPRARLAKVGDRIRCAIAAPVGGAAWATVRDPQGTVAIEIAPGDDAARARETDVDPAQLERMSAALDSDSEVGESDQDDGGGDGDVAGGDGGVGDGGGDGGVHAASGGAPDAGAPDAMPARRRRAGRRR